MAEAIITKVRNGCSGKFPRTSILGWLHYSLLVNFVQGCEDERGGDSDKPH
jgi:hypothetical protein